MAPDTTPLLQDTRTNLVGLSREALAAAVLRWLDDPAAGQRVAQRFQELHLSLKRDTARAATDAIAQVIGA